MWGGGSLSAPNRMFSNEYPYGPSPKAIKAAFKYANIHVDLNAISVSMKPASRWMSSVLAGKQQAIHC
jgi:hypothetical protein